MTEYEPEVRGKKTSAAEQHQGTGRRYVKRCEVRSVNGKDEQLYYWVRSCDCGQEADPSNMLAAGSENLTKMDGVEVHLKKDCKWVQPETGTFYQFMSNLFYSIDK